MTTSEKLSPSTEGVKIVIVNHAVNYLTIDLANAFARSGVSKVALIAGSIHAQREPLCEKISVSKIARWRERPTWRKAISYAGAIVGIWWLLLTRYRGYEVLFLSSPPMGYLLSLFVPNRCSMLIWDLYPDTFKITGMSPSHPVYRLWSWLNRRAFRKAYRLFTIGEVMADAMAKYVSRDKLIIQPIWSLFPKNERVPAKDNPLLCSEPLANKFVVQYSGNIGLTHNVEILVALAERLKDETSIFFQIIGRGARVPTIAKLIQSKRLGNIQLLPFQPDGAFTQSLSAANLGVVILDEKVGEGSVPSKAYNLMGLGIPTIYFSSAKSELALYAIRYGHAQCFSSEQLDQAEAFIREIAKDKALEERMGRAAEVAAEHFRPRNAMKFVSLYFSHYLGRQTLS